MNFDPENFSIALVVILLGFTVHEYAHAKIADAAGDPTPGFYGRVTLNPLKHLDPLGTIMLFFMAMTGYGIAWGKPVPMDPKRMRNPRWDHFFAVLAGPMSNFIQAAVYAVAFRVCAMNHLLTPDGFWTKVLLFGVLINVGLGAFNMFPMGPLDGMWLVGAFLPEKQRYYWTRWNLAYGSIILLAIILIGQGSNFSIIGSVLRPVTDTITRVLMGRSVFGL